jgi:putative ABC transport system permease protein
MRESLNEIWDSILRNKLRTFLTGFSVAWGIFMLVVLLGVGNGLKNGTQDKFKDDAIRSMWLSGGQTSLPHNGLQPGRSIVLRNADYDLLSSDYPGVEKISGRYRGGHLVNYKNKSSSFTVQGVHPDHKFIEKTEMVLGRYLNLHDIQDKRKVCIIGDKVKNELFEEDKSIGEWVNINGIPFRVVGIFVDEGSEGENSVVFVPISVAQLVFSKGDELNQIVLTTDEVTIEESKKIENTIRMEMAKRHNFDVEDPRALYIRNNYENFQRIGGVLDVIQTFVWIIGLLTIIAGVVGVSNIMIITVQERTKEIGIRKALGARPRSIVAMILRESVVITAFFGYFGLFLGVFLLELVSRFMPPSDAVFKNPTVDLNTAVWALVVLVFAGALAGFFPAWRASKIKPVEALSAKG